MKDIKVCILANELHAHVVRQLLLGVGITDSCGKDDADVIVVGDLSVLHEVYSEDRNFIFFPLDGIRSEVPKNVSLCSGPCAIIDFMRYFSVFDKKNTIIKKRVIAVETSFEYLSNYPGALKVLVVDDRRENLKLALELLGDCNLTLANGYEEAVNLIRQNKYDVVLSDCQMPSGMSSMAPGIVVHNGIFLMFLATMSGAKFAIVTDANHHTDWMSAIFDDLTALQNVNGQSVLLINYMAKQWDEALKKLLSL